MAKQKPKSVDPTLPSEKQQKIAWFLRTWILFSGIYQTFFGETVAGILTLICLFLIVSPALLSRGRIKRIPIEIEIILFVMVIIQFIIGEARHFYTTVPYYDKFVHFMLPFFVGLIAFLLMYTLTSLERLKLSVMTTVVVILLIAAGVGAIWEVIEYANDVILYPRIPDWHHFQGNAEQSAIDDTMTDIIIDTLGGFFGALLGVRYIAKRTLSGDQRIHGLASEIAPLFGPTPVKKKKKK